MQANQIYQYSLVNALMSGVCETGITVATLISKNCNQGLGTFTHMDGEMVLLDGKVFRLSTDGLHEAARDDQMPLVVAVNFVPEHTIARTTIMSKQSIDVVLSKFIQAKNLFTIYRIKGNFAHIKCRTVRGQQYLGQPLAELGQNQSVQEYQDIEGTIVGFRSPQSWQGFAVAGDHVHFVSDDLTKGGHVLELVSAEDGVDLTMAVSNNIHFELPMSGEYNAADLVTDSAAVQQVEG